MDAGFNGIGYASSLFRMEGFFLISGFLSAMLVVRYGASRTVRRRLLSVGVPLVTALALCNPLALWLQYNHHNPDISFLRYVRGDAPTSVVPQVWLMHLWFLSSLLVYAICTPAAFAALSRLARTPAFDWIARTRLRAMTAILSVVVATTVLGRGAHQLVVEPAASSTPFAFMLEVTIEFAPFYLIGLLLYMSDQRLLAWFG
nr:acyltransferase family protein [Micromonospora sp. DSM 115978]